MLILSAMLLQSASVAIPSTVESASDPSIVVNGSSLASTRAALDRCLAAQCPPDQDIRASLRYANQQFLAGDYVAARRTVISARRRNDGAAKAYPEPVSDLARAETKLAMVVGRPEAAFASSLDAVSALKSGLPSDSPIVMMQRLELGDQLARQGRLEGAAAMYDQVAAQGRAINNLAVEGHALYRSAVLFSAVASVNSNYQVRARQAIARVADRTEPGFAPFREGLVRLSERLNLLKAPPSQRAALLAEVPKGQSLEPVLLSEPFVDVGRAGLSASSTAGTQSEWADVSFQVKPDGTVDDVEVRQTSDYTPGAWLPLRVEALRKRRYAPFVADKDRAGIYRVERYSMVYDMSSPTGSRVSRRSPVGRLDTTPLSSAYRGKLVPVQ